MNSQLQEKLIKELKKYIIEFTDTYKDIKTNSLRSYLLPDEMRNYYDIHVSNTIKIIEHLEKYKSSEIGVVTLKLISEYLNNLPFSIDEKFEIVVYFIKNNIKEGILNPDCCFINADKVYQDINNKDRLDLEKILISKETVKKYIDNTRIFKESYLDKIDTFNSNDIVKIVASLENLELDGKLCSKIEKKLKKDLEKRQAKKKINIPRYKSKNIGIITEEEYQEIRKYLNQYIDIYKLDLKFDTITEQERDYIATLLFKLGEDKDVVRQFLIKTEELVEKEDLNPSEKFQKDYKKYEYYKEKYGLADDIDTINNLCLMLEDEKDIEMRDYIEKEIEKLLQNINMKIPKYGYELKVLNDDKNNVYIKNRGN